MEQVRVIRRKIRVVDDKGELTGRGQEVEMVKAWEANPRLSSRQQRKAAFAREAAREYWRESQTSNVPSYQRLLCEASQILSEDE